MDEYTDDEFDLPIDEKVDMYQVLQDKITTISIDNIVDELEVIKRLLLHINSKTDNVLSFVKFMIQKLNTIAIQVRGFVSFIADQIEDIMYEICIETQYNGMDQLQLRDPPLPPVPIPPPIGITIPFPPPFPSFVPSVITFPLSSTIITPYRRVRCRPRTEVVTSSIHL
jgi:hypothetical protein